MAADSLNVRPANQANAIVQATFAFELSEPLSPAVLDGVASSHELVKNLLPRKQLLKGSSVSITLDAGQGATIVPSTNLADSLVGVAFQQFKQNGELAWQFSAQGHQVLIACQDYTRWDTVWGLAKTLLSQTTPPIFQDVRQRVRVVALQYVDQFLTTGSHEKFTPAAVFDVDSPMLPKGVFENGNGAWHCHQGVAEPEILPGWAAIHQTNVDCQVRPDAVRMIQIAGVHRAISASSESSSGLMKISDEEPIDQLMFRMHDKNKSVLKRLLSEPMRKRIGL